jgi:hypothetical protein
MNPTPNLHNHVHCDLKQKTNAQDLSFNLKQTFSGPSPSLPINKECNEHNKNHLVNTKTTNPLMGRVSYFTVLV